MLARMKKKTFPMKPYEMHIVDGRVGRCPTISNVQLLKGVEGEPVQFTCTVHYEGNPEIRCKLRGKQGSFASSLLPSILVELHALSFTADIHMTMSLKDKYAKVYFLAPPVLEWNLDVEVGRFEIPLDVEEMMDSRLEKEFAKINEQNPHIVRMAAQVTVKQTATHSAFGQSLQGKTKKEMKAGTAKDFEEKFDVKGGSDTAGMEGQGRPAKSKSFMGSFFSKSGEGKEPKVRKTLTGGNSKKVVKSKMRVIKDIIVEDMHIIGRWMVISLSCSRQA